jgi:hypothetical protein
MGQQARQRWRSRRCVKGVVAAGRRDREDKRMAELTRRRFLTYTSLGVAGAAAAVAGGAELVSRAGGTAAGASSAAHTEPIVLMVRDAARGEVALMVGTSEKIYRDRDLVGRLLGAAGRVGS